MGRGLDRIFKDYDSVYDFIRENKLDFERRKDRANTIGYMIVDYFTKFRMKKGYEPIGVELLVDSAYERVTVTASYEGNDVSCSFELDDATGIFETVMDITYSLSERLCINSPGLVMKSKDGKPIGLRYNRKPTIEKVIYNGPATIIFWSDHTKTVSKCMKSDTYDREKGLAIAMAKKMSEDDFKRVKECDNLLSY